MFAQRLKGPAREGSLSLFHSCSSTSSEKCCYRDLSLHHSRSSQPTRQESCYVNENNKRKIKQVKKKLDLAESSRGVVKDSQLGPRFNKSSVCAVASSPYVCTLVSLSRPRTLPVTSHQPQGERCGFTSPSTARKRPSRRGAAAGDALLTLLQ